MPSTRPLPPSRPFPRRRRLAGNALAAMVVLATLLLTVLWVFIGVSPAQQRGTVVVFTANWCASCREVVPIARDVARQAGLDVVEIDVDGRNAPNQAKTYGLSIPQRDLPQVFAVGGSGSRLVFDGRNYPFGRQEQVRAILLRNLQP